MSQATERLRCFFGRIARADVSIRDAEFVGGVNQVARRRLGSWDRLCRCARR